jgi:signal transduction histidine kinase
MGRQIRLTRLKNDLIATVSHELKTPLTSIRVLTDTLLAGKLQDEVKAHEYLQLIARENVRLSRLIDSFLTFSRMERNKKKFEMRDVRPAEIAGDAVEAVRERYMSAGFALDVNTEPDLPVVLGDRDALVTVVINLLDNAWKYSQNDKRVSLRTYAADSEVRFEVADHGIGLSRREVRRIFEKFYQVDRSLSREASGVGLGLSIVRFIVGAHGGRIDVTSKPGTGSTFTVCLPGVKPQPV